MPFTPAKKKRYDQRRYHDRKARKPDTKKIYYPLRLEESIVAQAQLMASEAIVNARYPWKTAPQVLRALIVLGFKKLREDGDQIVSEGLQQIEVEDHLAQISRSRRAMSSILAHSRVEIGALVEIKADNEALQYYASTMHSIEAMSVTVWTEWLRLEMVKAFPVLHGKYKGGKVPGIKMQRRRKTDGQKRSR